MNEQPEALRLAEWAEWFCRNVNDPKDFRWAHMAESAAELRRLHAENEALRESLKTEELISFRRQMQGYAAQVENDEALMRKVLDALEYISPYYPGDEHTRAEAIAAMRKRLGVKP